MLMPHLPIGAISLPALASFLLGVPMFAVMLLSQFRLEGIIARPRHARQMTRLGVDPDGNQIQTDIWQGPISFPSGIRRRQR